VTLRVREAAAFFGSPTVQVKRWLVSPTVSDAHHEFKTLGHPTDASALQLVDTSQLTILDGLVDVGIGMPAASVSLIDITPLPQHP